MPDSVRWIVQEVLVETVVRGVGIGGFGVAVLIQYEDARIRVGHEDGRMGADDELGVLVDELPDASKELDLALWGEGGFGLVQEVQPATPESLHDEREEAFAMRLFVEADAAVRVDDSRAGVVGFCIKSLNLAGDVEVALRSQEILVPRARPASHQP